MKIQRNTDPVTEGYKGLFKGMSENLDNQVGKKVPGISYEQKKTHFDVGWDRWQQSYQSIKHLHFDPKARQYEGKMSKHQTSNFDVGSQHLSGKEKLLLTEQQKQFQNYGSVERARPKQDRQQLLAAQIVLGQDRAQYGTTTHENHGENLKLPPRKEIPMKPHARRFDIVTNKEMVDKRLDNACAFDYWNENKDKKHQSFNHSYIPKAKMGSIDPITNRKIS